MTKEGWKVAKGEKACNGFFFLIFFERNSTRFHSKCKQTDVTIGILTDVIKTQM